MKNIFLILLISVVFFSCSKKETTSPSTAPSVGSRIKTVSTGTFIIQKYYYDGSGRVIAFRDFESDDSTAYEYDNNIITEKLYVSGTLYPTTTGVMQNGRLISMGEQGGFQTSYEYDANGFLSKRTSVNGDTTWFNYTNFKVLNDNFVESDSHFPLPYFESTSDSTCYFTDKANSINYPYYGITYLGKGSKNLPKKHSRFFGTTRVDVISTYTFDAQGRVSTMSETDREGSNFIVSFQYY